MAIKMTSPSDPEVTFIIDLAQLFDDYEDEHGCQVTGAEIKLLLPAYTKAFKNNRRTRKIELDAEVVDHIAEFVDLAMSQANEAVKAHPLLQQAMHTSVSAVDMLKYQLQETSNKVKTTRPAAKGFA